MKLTFIIILILIENICANPCANREWSRFKLRFGKIYKSTEEERLRFDNFKRNLDLIDKHNDAAGKSFTMGLNEYSDRSLDEIKSKMLGLRMPEVRTGATFLPPHHLEVPKHVDWRTKGYVTKVKNQGQCGSCWAFSTTGSLEGQHFRKTGKLVSLSEQQLVDCSQQFGNQGCDGGLMDNAFNYIKANHGIDTEKSYPYTASDGTCAFKRKDVGADDTGHVDLPQGNETSLMMAVASVGPISVAIDASHYSFSSYTSGVYEEAACSPVKLDHGVLVVGYGTYQGKDYWLVKNSWGPSWGMQGYIMMARNKNNMCGIATMASYPLV